MSPRLIRYTILFSYFLILDVLFFLPGSAFPQETWLDKVGFDKWVHIGLLGILSFLLSWAFQLFKRHHFILIFISLSIYGIIVECIQHWWVPNRSFDWGDWAADIIGILLGLVVWYRYAKKIDPCRNRGRNQN